MAAEACPADLPAAAAPAVAAEAFPADPLVAAAPAVAAEASRVARPAAAAPVAAVARFPASVAVAAAQAAAAVASATSAAGGRDLGFGFGAELLGAITAIKVVHWSPPGG
ncbi:hypothetical protein H7J49_03610 [Mycobacterium branderi]|uniref:Uncharacterized protein n=1 Tax=Mycobacterium branderi TaxID=43348 RepID=A0ABN6B9X2_9MYCO|nr:hypothetical protein [Mycobacterium branderi]BBZ13628.1 hypothetical protein MBRA_38230 [Mycobacterium branderi]